MNKLITIIAGCMLLLGATSCGRTDKERSHILKVYNWGGLYRRGCSGRVSRLVQGTDR